MNFVKKKGFNNQLKEIVNTNNKFDEFLDGLSNKEDLQEVEKINIQYLKQHLDNMNVIFTAMQDEIK